MSKVIVKMDSKVLDDLVRKECKKECIELLQMLLDNNIRPTSHEAFYLKNNSINAKPGYYLPEKIYEFSHNQKRK